ncbi:DNA ligase D [Alkalihalobacterium chitinilyticum]|uniref:DNA ligase (ATP) n=1 Tax=Alkalihalobacterium chitinilyticum TaxID=2980103 RepID=A0ABT5VBE9_9BACI|nr:DNA ligase D [Alkalihalobacterium chitinilyticum]MDE5412776.1 DNA ligase D [Alkalihalobacterium chitinilyticum]
MKKPMSPTLSFETPVGEKWKFEIKYDGYRCLLKWSTSEFSLISKNGRILNEHFPELVAAGESIQSKMKDLLPLELDGEIVVLENELKGDFEAIQRRGRLRNEETIKAESNNHPVTFCIFDILELNGKNFKTESYSERKQKLYQMFQEKFQSERTFKLVTSYDSFDPIWKKAIEHDSEGVIAKLVHSKWENGRTRSWLKIKNYKRINCFITAFEKENGYFHVGLWNKGQIVPIGLFKHGIKSEEERALIETIKNNKSSEDKQFIKVDPGICIEIKYLQFYKEQLREPFFEQFRFDLSYKDCTLDQLHTNKQPPVTENEVEITSPDKVYWKALSLTKKDYIDYIENIAPYFLPFLKDRHLTVIRYPNGVEGEAFFQKNIPDYAPSFVDTSLHEGINYIVCQSFDTLLWLGNQGAIEFHIPFQTINSHQPREIVFDLDPHSVDDFQVAVKGARMIKEICDQLGLFPFVKTSGGKGIQVHLPLKGGKYAFEETRIFTSFVADFLVSKEPDLFTIERMKKKRGKRLYVDYIQHAEGKTIIAPYSARGRKEATVATPLFWEELNEQLAPTHFTIDTIIKRLNKKGCPFENYFEVDQPLDQVIDFLTQKK